MTMYSLDDTQPNKPVKAPIRPPYEVKGGVAAPPKLLFYGVIFLFIIGIIGTIAGVVLFREVLSPGQQVRIMGYAPFMEAFLPPRPDADDTVPTARPVDEEAAQNLLTSPLNLSGIGGTEEPDNNQIAAPEVITETAEVTAEPEIVETSTPEPTEAAAVVTEIPNTPDPTEILPSPAPANEQTAVETPAEVQNTNVTSRQTWEPVAYNSGFRWDQQKWNNCGPANITVALSYYGWTRDQDYAASYIRPNAEDKNVSPHELVHFVTEQTDINAIARVGGDLDLLRTLVSNEFPVIIERGHMFEGYEWLGHYQTIVGYSDAQRIFFIYDTFLGIGNGDGTIESYDAVDDGWQAFNRTFIVVYDPVREQTLMQILGDRAEEQGAAEHAYTVAVQEAREDSRNAFAWFNMGSSLVALGRHQEATVAYDKALQLGTTWRMLWYQFGPFEAYYETGNYEEVLSFVNNNLSNGGEYVEETYYWQGRALAAMGDTNGAITAFRNALRRNPQYVAAQDALNAINS